ncbi:aspartyl protease family protein [Pedobacter sp. MC2016-15]|uniref:aspartyl protease family protein n=1 Tax=Pedobacter sp. MC2016-15 TaxID=2994473 RepID=UPI0022472271|nr:aspartyl protease family protein [Pedobacter sp. MC2016-15]MCX2479147.1 aspartyl protease family protein [Pedobacter sp. MC2016-15]
MRTISIPLTLINLNDDGFHLLVEITAYGTKHLAVVDTGASRSVFDKGFIERNSTDVTTAEDTSATTLFSTSATIQAVIPKLKIGKLLIKNYHTVALDLETVNEAYELLGHPRIIAIIGSDIFYSYQAKINYKKLKIFFSQKAR